MTDEAQQIGTVVKAAGAVSARHADGSQDSLQVGGAVHQGDVVTTGGDGSVGIAFVDKSTFSLGPKAQMTLDDMVYAPGGDGHSLVSVQNGPFSFVSGQIAKTAPGAMQVKTPVMTMGVRGTTVAGVAASEGGANSITLLADPDGTLGEVLVSNAGGVQVINQPGATLQLSSAFQPPPPPVILSASQIQGLYGSALSAQPSPPPMPPEAPPPSGEGQGQGEGQEGQGGTEAPQQEGAQDPGDQTDPGTVDFVDANMELIVGTGLPETVGELLGDLLDLVQADLTDAEGAFATQVDGDAAAEAAFQDFIAELEADTEQDVEDILDELGQITVITGTLGADSITGTSGIDWISPLAGNDTVDAGAGSDIVFAQLDGSNDTFSGGDGFDIIAYDTSPSSNGDQEGVTIRLDTGSAAGGVGYDYLSQFEGVSGSAYNDTIYGDAGDNIIIGNAGDDTLWESDGVDAYDGGAGSHDLLSFAWVLGQTVDISIDLETGIIARDCWGNTGTVTGVEDVRGGLGNDSISGDAAANVLSGMVGNDTLIGRDGADTLDGGDGADTLVGGEGADELTGGADADTFQFTYDGDSTTVAEKLQELATDTITDFSSSDIISLDNSLFGLGVGQVTAYGELSDWADASTALSDYVGQAGVVAYYDNVSSSVQVWFCQDMGNVVTSGDTANSYQIATLAGTTLDSISAANVVSYAS